MAPRVDSAHLTFLAGGGEMGARMREMDWSDSSLGAPDTWPQSLRSTVGMLLPSKAQIILFWGPEFTVLYNDAYRPVFGAKHPHVLGLPGQQAWSEIWESQLHPLLLGVVQTGEAFHARDMLFQLERYGFLEETYFDVSYDPVRVESGDVGGAFCIVTETTERVVGTRRLGLLRDLAAQNAAARTERDACVLAMEALAAKEDVAFALAYLADELQAATPGAEQSLVTARPDLVKTISIDSATDSRPARLVVGINPRRPFDEGYLSFLELVADQFSIALTNARAYQAERQRAEALAAIDRAKTTFFSNVSHEFRTPLTLLVGPLEEELADPATLPAHRERIETAHRNALRLLRLVNNLLDFSRIEAGRIDASYEPTDLVVLTCDLASTFRSAIEKAGLRLVVDCPPLPHAVYVDREMWEKVVLNLLSNAFKFTFEGEIRVELRWKEDHVELLVSDTGVGIAKEDLDRVFERFHRIKHARARTHEGTGIGLALVQELARLHGGTVTVASEAGRGTTFTVSIRTGTTHLPPERISAPRQLATSAIGATPYVEEALRWLPEDAGEAASSAESHPASASATGAPDGRARLLIADDNADMRNYLTRILGQQYQVDAVADGRSALERIETNPPDLVLSDVMMPELDGFGLLSAVRGDQQMRSIPMVLLSARAGEEARIEGLRAGADEYLVKPFSSRELLACVSSQLQLARLRQETVRLLQENATVTETLNNVGAIVTSDLDRDKVVQAVTDAATELTNAKFGAFFYNVRNEDGEAYTLYTISGVPREAFSKFPMPRNTGVFEPTFTGTGVVRSDDITKDPRYGHNEPYHGMPPGHLPVRSYLAVPVKGRGEVVIGGLFFGHPEAAKFTVHDERIAVGIAAWASVALENAQLYMNVQEASRLKDDFLAGLSHELRTPLNAILGYTRMLRSGVIAEDRKRKAIETIERNATSLTQIVEDVLDISRIVSGKIRLNVQRVDLPAIVRNAIDAVMPAADAKGVRVETVIDPEASPISGDPERLQQVLWNLLSNAIKFTNRGGKVQVRLERVNSHLELTVSDTGIGIAREFLPHVFERFRQADAGFTRERGGLGLGLSIARQLTELHGGTIEVSSAGLGHGSTFRVKIPVMLVHSLQDELPRVHPRARSSSPPSPEVSLDGIHVLAVDDEPDALALAAELLEDARARVTTARTVEEALEKLVTETPDVVVADLGMPQVDGFAFIEQLRHHANPRVREIPAVALTAYARSEDRMKALQAGFQIHLAKPVEPAELVTTIASLARRVVVRSSNQK
ncbi:MAG TPA: ATP-binding protein [Vicinamibacterales bacterium]|nr:ATP-binding protein [Vicinamibacterales bacterium]